ncbi:SMP-30/gluconolactonase/LRE family protein [Rhizobium leguminosarum]|nr:SMP-30/gluconolactonase/LRE family protein [Rhizobium leguminosarum]
MQIREAKLLASDFIFLEAPRWKDGAVWAPDVFDSILYRVDMQGKKEVVVRDLPPRPNSFNFLPDGTPIIVSSVARHINKIVDGKLELYVDLSNFATGDLNDFGIDDSGRLYVGNFGYDIFAGEPIKLTSIHTVEPDGRVSVAATDMEFPNGTVLINSGRTLIVSETWCGRISSFDRDLVTGALSNRRQFADLSGRHPDGICVDAEGAIWVSSFNTGEVLRVLDGGEITDRIEFEGSAIACELGGPDGHTLFCTTYSGTYPDQMQHKRLGLIHTVVVDVPAPSE